MFFRQFFQDIFLDIITPFYIFQYFVLKYARVQIPHVNPPNIK